MRSFSFTKVAVTAMVGTMVIGAGTLGSMTALAASPDGFAAGAPTEMTEAAAKKHITDDNYTNVTSLYKVKDGWTANAKSLGSPVSLLITYMGDIDQQ